MAFYRIEKNYVVDDGSYTFGVHKFTRVERKSARTKKNNNVGSYLHTCYTANKICQYAGAKEAIVPLCHPCSTFASEVKTRKSLFGKSQDDVGVSKQFKCEWMLRSLSDRPRNSVATADKQSTKESTSSTSTTKQQSRTVPSNRKRSQKMVLEEQAAEGEKKISKLEEEIAQLKNAKKELGSKLKKEEEISESYKQDLGNMYRDLDSPLSTAITNLMMSQYTRYDEKKWQKLFLELFLIPISCPESALLFYPKNSSPTDQKIMRKL